MSAFTSRTNGRAAADKVAGKRADPVAGKVVLITGAARGIGAGVARRLAQAGATLALVGLEAEELRKVAAECGPTASAWDADVTDWAQLEAAVAGIAERYGRIDVVMANAGIAAAGFIRSIDPAAFEKVIEVDLLGVWRTVRVCLPHLISSRGYCLIVSSMAAVVHIPGNAPYNAAKAGVEAFGNTLRAEVRHFGVAVGVAHPTWISTDMVNSADEHPVFGPLRASMPGPLGRTYPLSVAVDAFVAGIARRARTIHIPAGLLLVKLVRALLPPVVELSANRLVPKADAAALADVKARGAAASAPVGPGGAAAMNSRTDAPARAED
jgi:NAD(P)-dependent dehydrogenase (short-subunit alcohol dehydrogenase family)